MLQKLRESLALVLIALLPFHALVVTAGTKWLMGPQHAPLGVLALWKEAALLCILCMALSEFLLGRSGPRRWRPDILDMCIVFLVMLSVLVSAATHGDWKLFTLGFKYDFLAPVAFVLLRRVPWSPLFLSRAVTVLMCSACVLALYGFWTLVAPSGWFTWLGYSDLHSLYVPGGPIAVFQQIGASGIRRLQSAMSGPNQLGLWMLIPWSIGLSSLLRRSEERRVKSEERMDGVHQPFFTLHSSLFTWLFLALAAASIILSFSRSAWIGAFVMLLAAAATAVPAKTRSWVMVSVAGIATIVALALALLFPSVLLRFASSRDHIVRPIEAMHRMITAPLGSGLGTAGPASNRVSDACVFLDAGADASWAADRPNLCVFAGDVQVQPVGKVCSCPFLPENWYLQIGVELGVAGFVLYLALVGVVLMRLRRVKSEERREKSEGRFVFLAFLGVSMAALFLHAWEDSALAYTLWVLAAVVLPARRNPA